jgi:alpha-beta hydrolase superfamily lysophospholipase
MEPFRPVRRGSITTTDGLSLHAQWRRPEAASPRAAVVLVHGYAEHCGRYGGVARALADAGALVYAYDQRGFGRSGGRRAYVDTFDQYLDDLAHVLSFVRARTPDVPLFLFGHSMGGLVALKYVLDRSPTVAGLMLSAPALEINPDLAPLLRRLAHLLGRLAPTLPTVRSPEGALSRDPAVVEAAQTDPLNYHGRIPARTGAELLRAGADVRGRLDTLTRPFLVLHGTADPLAEPKWSRRLYARAAAPDKTLRLYEGSYHEPFHDYDRAEVLADLSAWLRERAA